MQDAIPLVPFGSRGASPAIAEAVTDAHGIIEQKILATTCAARGAPESEQTTRSVPKLHMQFNRKQAQRRSGLVIAAP